MSICTPSDFLRTMQVLEDLGSHPLADEVSEEVLQLSTDLEQAPYKAIMIENTYQAVPKEHSGLVAIENVVFDDVVKDDVSHWSQICGSCQHQHPELEAYLSEHGYGVCGVVGCSNPEDEHTRYINLDNAYTETSIPNVTTHTEIVTRVVRQVMSMDGKSIRIAIERFFCDQCEYLDDSEWLVDGEKYNSELLNAKLIEHLNESDGKALVYTINVLLSDWVAVRVLYLGDSLYKCFVSAQTNEPLAMAS